MLVVVAGRGGPASAGGPTETLRDFFGGIDLVLADPRTEDQPLEKLKAIRRHVDDVLDVREAAMLALGREWTARTPGEQNEFVALFADLLERSFVWRLAGKASIGGGLKVRYLGETVADDTATVDTTVATRDGNDLRIEYRMVRRAARWVVRDVVMDGVSTMENYHAQFQRVVRDASWRDLMAQLRAKVGAPAVAPQIAAPPPTLEPTIQVAGLLASPLAPPDPERPAPADDRHAAARDLAAVVTPGLVLREGGPLGAPRPPVAAPVVSAPPPPRPTASTPAPTVPLTAPQVVAAVPPSPATPVAATPSRAAKPALARPVAAPAGYWVQVGAFRNSAIARRTAGHVKGVIFVVRDQARPDARGEPLLRVRVGPFRDRAAAFARLRELEALGYRPFLAAPH
jgi:ABC-type transporter MlaC component